MTEAVKELRNCEHGHDGHGNKVFSPGGSPGACQTSRDFFGGRRPPWTTQEASEPGSQGHDDRTMCQTASVPGPRGCWQLELACGTMTASVDLRTPIQRGDTATPALVDTDVNQQANNSSSERKDDTRSSLPPGTREGDRLGIILVYP